MTTAFERSRKMLEGAARDPAIRLAVFAALAYVVLEPLLRAGNGMNPFHDAQFLSAYERHARMTVLGYGELPLWDPYTCGGMYGLAAPQIRYASPFFLVSLVFGVDRAVPIILYLCAIIGTEGTFRYARDRGARLVPAMVFAPLAGLSGFYPFAWHFGWIQFVSFQFLPFMMLGLRLAMRGEFRGARMLAIATTLALGLGGTWTLPMAMIPMTVELMSALVPSIRRLRARPDARAFSGAHLVGVLRGALVGTLLALLVAGYRLVPMLESAPSTLRVMGGVPEHDVLAVLRFLFAQPTDNFSRDGQYYIGAGAIVALTALASRRARPLWAVLVLTLLLALGHITAYAPFALLRTLPVYESMRYPERMLVFAPFAFAVLGALGTSSLLARARRSARRGPAMRGAVVVAMLIAVATIFDLRNVTGLWVSVAEVEPSPEERIGRFRQARGNRWLASHWVETGLGTLSCGEAYPVPMSVHLRGDLPEEAYLADASRGRVRTLAWSPNRIVVEARLERAARLRINQNHHVGWKTNVGRVVTDAGLLAVELPAGTHRVVLRFAPSSATIGLCASLIGLVLAFALGRHTRGIGLRTLAAVTLPIVVLVALGAAFGDPLPRAPEPRTPEGAPIVLDALPESATPIDVRFGTGLVLVGYELGPLSPTRERRVTLYWKRTGEVSANEAVFLHVYGEGRTSGDHPVFSSNTYPSRAPLGRVLRDEVDMRFPRAAADGYKMYVGLWNAYSDATRVPITHARGVRVFEHAVAIDIPIP